MLAALIPHWNQSVGEEERRAAILNNFYVNTQGGKLEKIEWEMNKVF